MPKHIFSRGLAKKILAIKSDPDLPWLEREVEELMRSRSLPPQLLSNEFMSALQSLFEAKDAAAILETLRTKYLSSHPWAGPRVQGKAEDEEEDD